MEPQFKVKKLCISKFSININQSKREIGHHWQHCNRSKKKCQERRKRKTKNKYLNEQLDAPPEKEKP